MKTETKRRINLGLTIEPPNLNRKRRKGWMVKLLTMLFT